MELTMPLSGRTALACAIKERTITLAVGEGKEDWGTKPPAPDGLEAGLVAPLAFVRARAKQFVKEDKDGDIEMADGSKWSLSKKATKYLYVTFVLGFTDDPDKTLREMAVYIDTEFAKNAPPGREYNGLSDVEQKGQLLLIGRIPPVHRQAQRQTISEIMTF
jgi:hypothetical protein